MSEYEEIMQQKAVALKYNPEKNGAPVIVASGMGYMAERITETAMEAGVPVYEDDSLATLLTQLKLGAEIPRELYQAIVEIYIYFLGYVPQENEAPAAGEAAEGMEGEAELPEEMAVSGNGANMPVSGDEGEIPLPGNAGEMSLRRLR